MDIQNCVMHGDSEQQLKHVIDESVGLIFTSPPYYNARPQYAQYKNLEEYLDKMRRVFTECKRVLGEGRFLVVNSSPVLIPRKDRSHQSTRVHIPFELFRIIVGLGFDFIEDITWEKPLGAACGRGRGFARSRMPLTYKAEPNTERIMVFRKHTDKLIDWNIRMQDKESVNNSLVLDDYEKSEVWHISPAHSKKHPAIFPEKLAEDVIRLYSFKGDMVLDMFAGIGTVGKMALKNGRKFLLIEQNEHYCEEAIKGLQELLCKLSAKNNKYFGGYICGVLQK